MKSRNARTLLTVAGVAALGLSLGIGAVSASDDELGAWIYEGTCASPAQSPLHDIGDLDIEDHGRASGIAGTPVAGPVYEEDEGISTSLDELTASPHVVIIRASDDEHAPIVACGEISGEARDGKLEVPLQPVGNSGVSGVSTFGPPEDKEDKAEVVTQVQRGAAQAATPTA
ncbi:MAG: hypothetical protein IT338_02470 [Thermomicrobiales bacterium]|nr:hypothetical protein [Thermomicrobiales bacterium]